MDSRAIGSDIPASRLLELEKKLLHPTAKPISLPLSFLNSITRDFCDELGRGGYGVVYKGIIQHCGLIIAVKKIHDIHLVEDNITLFEKEVTFLMKIRHQNVVKLLGYCAESRWETGEVEGKYVLVEIPARMLCFEYLCNQSLDKHLSDESSGLEWNTRYKIIKGICSGLNFLHECNIIHLDLKPQNILMDSTMMPKIADFGLSRLLGEQKSQTVTKSLAGSPGYMAPEYIDKGIISKKADIFSLGVLIIEILKGCKDGYPDYRQSTDTDFQHFKEEVLSNWRNRFERASKYTALELHTQLVKQCIDIALECVHPDKEKRPNVLNIIEILNVAEGSCCDQNGEDLLVDHQVGTQEGVPPPGVLHEDDSVALKKLTLAMKDHAPAWITKEMMKSTVAPQLQPQREPVLVCVEGSLATLCYQGARNTSFWVAHNVLASLEDNILKQWAATINLGPSIESLQQELLFVKAILESTLGKVINNMALERSLMMLQDLVYNAEDVLDEMEYFRIQDMLDAGQRAEGCAHSLDLNVSPCSPQPYFHGDDVEDDDDYYDDNDNTNSGDDDDDDNNNNNYNYDDDDDDYNYDTDDYSYDDDDDDYNYDDDEDNTNSQEGSHTRELKKLEFNRLNASDRMQHIVEQMQLMRQGVYSTITLLGSGWSTAPNIAQSRPITTSESIEPKLYGRELMMKSIIDDITKGKHSGEVITVIPIVGPGGIGKTTLVQHIYHNGEVQEHFDVRVWTCVSLNFNVKKLTEEIQRYIPKIDGELTNDTASELIGQRLKNKRLLLVLDDIWDCSDVDEWKRLLVPFRKSQVQGNIIIVTTRFPAQAQIMVQKRDHSIYLQGLESKEFDELFLEIVFGDDDQCRKDHTFLLETGRRIAGRLKGSPLAAKTVGRLLKTQLDLVHWTRVLESKEWEQSNGKNDIMPALRMSFDCLPYQLQQCFSYCGLFPQDYKFEKEELINFWIGLQVIHSSHCEKRRVEDIGLSHLTELVNYGFLEKKVNKYGRTCYIIHDLLHELARKVSALECLSIDSSQSQVSSLEVLPSIRHLSINIDDISVNDRLTLKNYVEDFNTLDTRLKVEKLQTLMIFGKHHSCFVKAFADLFREAKGLHVIFLSEASYDVEHLLPNFYNLLHLRYLRVGNSIPDRVRFPYNISRFYHMMVLDAKHCGNIHVPKDMSNLVKLRHFLVQNDVAHAQIVEVGKLKSLQELRRFVVKQRTQGFELREIGHLVDLCGSLSIYNLENVWVKDEVDEAKLLQKNRIHELILHWDNILRSGINSTLEEHVLERLKPSNNLLKLSVKGHRGIACPSWLGTNLSIKSLESLCLDDVTWKTFPPIGELLLVNLPCGELTGNIPEERFGNLRRLELYNLMMVEKWVVHAPCQLFPFLEVLIIKDCPQLLELSFHHTACCQQGKEVNVNLFSRLSELKIESCPQLSSFPAIPWTEAPCSIDIYGTGISTLERLVYGKENSYECSLTIKGKDTTDSMFWNVVAFQNLTGLKELRLHRCESPPLHYLQMLSSLRILNMSCSINTFSFVEADSHVKYQFPVERLAIDKWNASGKELTQLLTYLPKLSDLSLWACEKQVTGLGVNMRGQQAIETPGLQSGGNEVEQQQEDDVKVALEEAERSLLLLPPQLQELAIWDCTELSLLRFNKHDNSNQDGPTWGGLQGLTSLRRLSIQNCPKLLSSYASSSFSSSFPFPNSLEDLTISGATGMDTLVPLSNLTSLTSLDIYECGDLRGEGLLSLLTQGHLTKLSVSRRPNFFVDSEASQVHEQGIPSFSSKLQELTMGDVAGFTVAPIRHSLLTKLEISGDNEVVGFTEEQEALLFVNSLEEITFRLCCNLLSLPERLHKLPKLKKLYIWCCISIQMLPKDGLPSSLQKLSINGCPQIWSLPKDCLPDSLQKLVIRDCPAIRSLPEVDDLPSSLRELDVRYSGSEELRRQCRKLTNIIPTVRP